MGPQISRHVRHTIPVPVSRQAHSPVQWLVQDYGGAVVIGDDVQASFDGCEFLDNGRPLCAEQDFTLVRMLHCLYRVKVHVHELQPLAHLAVRDCTPAAAGTCRCTFQGGGAINMGLDDFKGTGICSATRPNGTTVSVNGSTLFAGNVAKLQGGAVALQSGSLLLQVRSSWHCQKMFSSPVHRVGCRRADRAPAGM